MRDLMMRIVLFVLIVGGSSTVLAVPYWSIH
jgi:hypothetical protein